MMLMACSPSYEIEGFITEVSPSGEVVTEGQGTFWTDIEPELFTPGHKQCLTVREDFIIKVKPSCSSIALSSKVKYNV